jgi:magnesium-protoporphyrin O-methyltransferase
MNCCARESIEKMFDRAEVDRTLRRFRRRGPDKSTRLLVSALKSANGSAESLLDIGGGVGAIHHEMLDAGVREALEVDISAASLTAAEEETRRRGHEGRVHFVHGDFLDVADNIEPVDIVTLDRVICCYPDMDRLVSISAEKTKHLYGAVYPRDRWLVRIAIAAMNAWQRITGSDFRGYFHQPRAIAQKLADRGFVLRSRQLTIVWEVSVFDRTVVSGSEADRVDSDAI